MFFMPSGMFTGEVIDPEVLSKEYQRLFRLAARTGQHQWIQDAFASRDTLKRGDHVAIEFLEQEAHLYRDPYNAGTYNILTNNPDLSKATGDPNLWQFPYNRGLQEVSDENNAVLAVEWQSAHPELVWVSVDYQFIRNRLNEFGQVDQHIRAQLQIYIDEGQQPGSGPYAVPLNGKFRGTGFARRAGRSRLTALAIVPAGPHRVVVKGGQMPSVESTAEESEPEVDYQEDPPTEGVCLGNRKLIVVRFPRGGFLGA